ncbi:MAG: UvrD-helicase domain-containing protein, partial [Armatimonadota bacterium]
MSVLADQEARTTAAERFGASIALSAGAGSGKTSVLVTRYLNILERDLATVPQIVAVTFTEKAAAEMRERIRADCRARAREAAGDHERRLWQRHERDLEAAPVSTIHSLCARILREHSIAAAIDPQFRVLEEASADLLMAQAVHRQVLRRVHEGADTMRRLVAAFGVVRLRDILCQLIAQRDKWLQWLAGVADAESLVRQRLVADAEAQEGALAELVDDLRWQAAMATLESTEPLDPDDRAAQQRAAILDLAPVAADAELDTEQRVQALADMRAQCKKYGSKVKWPSPEALADVRDAFVTLRDLCGEAMKQALGAGDAAVAESSAERSAALAVELEGAHEAYQDAKRRRSAMDFADLQLGARDLLRDHARIRDHYRRQFKYILVDEFQDTNGLQKEILFALAGAERDPGPQPAKGKLFIVGDDKQSIYRFRGADVTVFNVTREDFALSEGAHNLELSINFRSQPGLVDFYNRLFSQDAVMGAGGSGAPYIARYLALDPHRTARPEGPDVEVILARPDDGSDDAGEATLRDLRETEAAAIAQRIEEICDDERGLQVFDPRRDDSEGPRRARCGDVAILFRALTDVRTYERALRRRGIPYYLIAGQGLYRRQEIQDLVCLLRALENARDEVAVVGALRSPLFALSDETLYWLCRDGQPYAALQRLATEPDDGQFEAIGPEERDKAARAAEILGELREVKDRLSISQLLTRAVEETGFLGALLAQFNGEQMASNVRKIIDLAAAFERGGLFSLHEFIGYLHDLIVTEQREGEAPVHGEEENVVKLLTIHKAKGLQWPIVVVPDLARGYQRADGDCLWHEPVGLIVKGEDAEGRRKWPAVGESARALDDKMEQAERRRLLYVACTRARDHLILSSPWQTTKGGQAKGGPWLQWVAEALAIDADTPDGPLAAANGNGWTGVLQSVRPNDIRAARARRRKQALAARHAAELKAGQPLPGGPRADEFGDRTRPLPPGQAAQQRFTVTQLATYLACPREYELRYVRDLPEYYEPLPDAHGPLLSPLERGTVAHRCLQRIGREREEDVDRAVRGCLRE